MSVMTDFVKSAGVIYPEVLENEISVRETLRRSYASAGRPMVDGSFELGMELESAADVGMHEASGKCYSSLGPFPHIVPAGTSPATGGFIDRSAWPVASMQEFNAGSYGLRPSNTGLQNCQALQALSTAVNTAGVGRIVFPSGTYIIGAQTFAGATGKGYSYKAEEALNIHDIGNVELHFEGCKFVMEAGLKYGSFHPVTGAAYTPTMPFYQYDYRAETGRLFRIERNKSVTVTGSVEFDANDSTRAIGGQWGDTGWQVWEQALYIRENTRYVSTAAMYLHKFMTDCAYFVGAIGADALMVVENLIAIKGGRNVVTWAGGDNCYFNECIIGLQGQGDSALRSLPASTIDVETEISSGRNLNFNNCEFLTSENGVTAIYANVYGVKFNNCNFYADRDDDVSLYWNVKGTDFNSCNFYGPMLTTNQNTNANHKLTNTIFRDCYITNIHKDGHLIKARADRAVLIDSTNTATINGIVYRTEFHRCRFNALLDGTNTAKTSLSIPSSIVIDCTLTLNGNMPLTLLSHSVANFNGAIIDGLEVINRLERENTDPSSTMYVGINSPAVSDGPAARNAVMNLKYNSNNLLTLVWNSAVQGSSSGWAGRYCPVTRSRFNELKAFDAIALRRERYAMSADRASGPVYITASPGVPTVEDFIKGDIIFNSAPSAGQAFGWKCTTAGTAGSTAVFKIISTLEA